ncbi:hypothetical protein Q9L58_009808 [Maublancomyces gigas]|uniref:Uncharacterized protein n=1 Tax=Discina gigas TaxID=1032678 RepID=A0ABR3G5V9_9PEZI
MGYAQWIILNIFNNLQNQIIQIKDVELEYGRFHKVTDKDSEISTSEISAMKIFAGHTGSIASSGRVNSPTGTTGSIDLYYDKTKICTLYWDCPWGSRQNTFEVRDQNSVSGYWCHPGHWNRDGAIGNVEVKVSNENIVLGADLNLEVGK